MSDFEAMLDETLAADVAYEGNVVRGKVVAVENDFAIIDVGLKMEGRVALKEFGTAGKSADLKVGDEVEVYLERMENALGEAVLSRDKARREESWVRLERQFEAGEKVQGVIFAKVKGGFTVDLDGAVGAPEVDAHRLLPDQELEAKPVDFLLFLVDVLVAQDDRVGPLPVAVLERLHTVPQRPLGEGRHLQDLLADALNVALERLLQTRGHDSLSP